MDGNTALVDDEATGLRRSSADSPGLGLTASDHARRRAGRMTVAMMTPWDQQCGNAEYAKRLVAGLEQFATGVPFDMQNFIDQDRRIGWGEMNAYFRDLVGRVNRCDADIIHLQHEFCFFARRLGPSNCRFADVMRRLKKPVVVSLHTWLRSMSPTQRRRTTSQQWANVLHRLRNRHISSALRRAAAIVLHSQETHKLFVEAYPDLKKRVHVVPIPIERVASAGVKPPFVKSSRDAWVMIPGFVSRYKGHGHMLAALQHLPESYKLVVAGGVHPKDKNGGDYWRDLIQQADVWGLQSRILFTGFLNDPASQAAMLEQADVFLLPYDEVGQSGSAVLADALSFDKPVITSRARSMFVYRMDKDTAFSSIAVDVGDPKALATVIRSCIRGEDTHYPEMSAQRAIARKRYCLEHTQAAYERVYREALSGGQARC